MHSAAAWSVFTSLLVSLAAAQNSNYSNFNPTAEGVQAPTLSSWCSGELMSCPLLCGGASQLGSQHCNAVPFSWSCLCKNGSEPANIAQYINTVPNNICVNQKGKCLAKAQSSNDPSCNCGTLDPKDVPNYTATASPTSAPTSTSAASSAPPASSASTQATNAAVARNVQGLEGAGLVGGLVAALLL